MVKISPTGKVGADIAQQQIVSGKIGEEVTRGDVAEQQRQKAFVAEQRRLAEEEQVKQQAAAEAAYWNEKIKIGTRSFARKDIKIALEQLNRGTSGKRMTFYEQDEAHAAFKYILQYGYGGQSGQELQTALDAGVGAKVAAQQAGFGTNVEEYFGVKRQLGVGFSVEEMKILSPEFAASAREVEAVGGTITRTTDKDTGEFSFISTVPPQPGEQGFIGPTAPQPGDAEFMGPTVPTPYIETVQIGEGPQGVPSVETYVVDPVKGTREIATPELKAQFEDFKKALSYERGTAGLEQRGYFSGLQEKIIGGAKEYGFGINVEGFKEAGTSFAGASKSAAGYFSSTEIGGITGIGIGVAKEQISSGYGIAKQKVEIGKTAGKDFINFADTQVRERITEPFIFKPLERKGISERDISEKAFSFSEKAFPLSSFLTPLKGTETYGKTKEYFIGAGESQVKFFREKPLTTTAIVGGSAYFGPQIIGRLGFKKTVGVGVGLIPGGTKPLDIGYEYLGKGYDALPFVPKGQVGGFIKGSIFSAGLMAFPTTGIAYGTQFAKQTILDPIGTGKETLTFLKESPGEFAGFAVGGALLRGGLRYGEYKFRTKAPVETITYKGQQVKTIDLPKYGKVVWVEGEFAASEKLSRAKQIKIMDRTGAKIFAGASPEGINFLKMTGGKGKGFRVAEMKHPGRGLYEAFAGEYFSGVKGSKGSIYSHYAELKGRERIVPRPQDFFEGLLSDAEFSTQRPSVKVRRGTISKTPEWIKSLSEGKKLNPKQAKLFEKYYQDFLKEPKEFKGKMYAGEAKVELFRGQLGGKGTPQQLKAFIAMTEFQKQTKRPLAAGPEILSGIEPWGPEVQLVSPIDVKYTSQSLPDLRKSQPRGIFRTMVEKITGTKRGQAVSMIDGQLIEIEYMRAYPGRAPKPKVKAGSQKGPIISDPAKINFADISKDFFSDAAKDTPRRRTGKTYASPRSIPILGRTTRQPTQTTSISLPRELPGRTERVIRERPVTLRGFEGLTRRAPERPRKTTERPRKTQEILRPTQELLRPSRTRTPKERIPRDPFRPSRTTTRPPTEILKPLIPKRKGKEQSRQKEQGFLVQVKASSLGKWVTISEGALTRQSALSLGSRATDATLARTFRIRKAKGKVKRGADDYWGRTQSQFRGYKIEKGQRKQLSDTFIERSAFAISTRGEKKGLSLAKWMKQQGLGSTTKRKKKSGKKKK